MRAFLLAVATLLATVSSAAELITPQNPVPGRYIVVLHEDDDDLRQDFLEKDVEERHLRWRAVAGDLRSKYGGNTERVFRRTLKGYVALMAPHQAQALRKDPRVRYIEQDSIVRIAGASVFGQPNGHGRIVEVQAWSAV